MALSWYVAGVYIRTTYMEIKCSRGAQPKNSEALGNAVQSRFLEQTDANARRKDTCLNTTDKSNFQKINIILSQSLQSLLNGKLGEFLVIHT